MKRARRRWLTFWPITLSIYWMAMFIGTHVPRVPPIHGVEPSDKVLHFLAYMGLVILMAAAWMSQTDLHWRHYCVIFMVAAVYAAFDEWLQIPVGRDCSLLDWYADVAGAFLGVLAFAILAGMVGRRIVARIRGSSVHSTSQETESN